MSTVIMYATRTPTCPHDNPSYRCHSVQVRSDLKGKYNTQRTHEHEIVHLLHNVQQRRHNQVMEIDRICSKYDCQSAHVMYHCVGLSLVRLLKKRNDYCTIFEEDTVLNVRLG